MDTFGHEVAVKIKSAIKAKLMELNSYVDDELPDYIMVMVANKKTKAQMSSDLALFLGENAGKFCEWLDEVLKRIQSVTIEPQRKLEIESNNKPETSNGDEQLTEDIENVPNEVFNNNEMVVRLDVEAQDEILAIKADTDDLLVDELNKEDAQKTKTPYSVKDNSNSDATITTVTHETHVKTKDPEISSLRAHRNISPITIDRTEAEEKVSSTTVPVNSGSRKRKLPSSTVGAVLKREFPQEDDEDEYDPRHPSIGAVASVIKVSKRRPTLPPEKQANTALLLKAVNDAQKSVLKTRIASVTKIETSEQPKLFTKSYLERNRMQRLMERRKEHQLQKELISAAESPKAPSEEVNLMEYDELQLEQTQSSEEVTKVVDFPAENVISSNCSNGNDSTIKGNRVVLLQEKRSASPEFIITLDGVDGGSFAEDVEMDDELEMTVQETDGESVIVNEEDGVSMEDDNRNDTDAENVNIRCKYWPVCKNGNQCNYHHPTVVCKTFPNCKFGNQCLYIHPNCKFDSTCSRVDCPFTHASPRNPFEIATKSRPSAVTKKPLTSSVSAYASKIVCRNFPSCKNVDCQFHHPKSCRYGQGCTRVDCVFFHPNSFPAPDKMKWKAKSAAEKPNLLASQQLSYNV